MKCTIAEEINKGANKSLVSKRGAKVLASNAEVSVHPRNLLLTTKFPLEGILASLDSFAKGASYIFSNNSEISTDGLSSLGVLEDGAATSKLMSAGANLYKGISQAYFNKNNKFILSPTPNNTTQIIHEGIASDKPANTDTRTFLSITDKDIKDARKQVELEFGSVSEENSLTKDQLFSEGMEFLVVSALFRGYDIAITGPLSSEIVKKAITRFGKVFAPGKKVIYSSSFRSEEGVVSTKSVNNVIDSVDAPVKSSKAIFKESLFLNYRLGEDERAVYDVSKPASLMSKLIVANRIINIFKDMMPNLDVKILTTGEIKKSYGTTFANKKNFIIDNVIILNQEKFSSATLFHEFSHYYSRWLSSYNPGAFEVLMDNVRANFSDSISGYSSLYNSTGIFHSEEAIIEEIFADKLGMLAAKELDTVLESVDQEDSKAIAETVDVFALDFIKKMTKNTSLKLSDTAFTINSSIADIFNIGVSHSRAINPASLISTDNGSLESLREFFVEKANAKEVFQGLVNRNLIREVSKNTIILLDGEGNRVNTDGNIDRNASYKYYPWDTVEHIKSNKKLLAKADLYLDKNKNFASVRFSLKRDPMDVVSIIRNSREGLELTEDGSMYQKDGVVFDRVTHFLQDQFSDKTEIEMFILNGMYSDYYRRFKRDSKEPETPELNIRAAEATKIFMENTKKVEFKNLYAEMQAKFDFKTSEGTYLHAIAEMFFRSLNYSNQITYKTKVDDPSPMYFAKAIRDAISGSEEEFTSYYENLYFNQLRGLEGTDDYKEFRKSYEFLLDAMKDRASSKVPAVKFIDLLISEVVPILNKLKGPITIMPEVKLASKTMGTAGTIDLLVVDGDGIAYIFDYKTKEVKKEDYWDWKQGTNMKGVMGPYKENAKMKASIQTSIYKLMLMELGVQTGPANIFYVESTLPTIFSTKGTSLNDVNEEDYRLLREGAKSKGLRYSPSNIKRKGVLDVSAELLRHFTSIGRTPVITSNAGMSADVTSVIDLASAGRNIDIPIDVKRTATNIYDRAIDELTGVDSRDKEKISVLENAYRGVTESAATNKTGLRVRMPGGHDRVLSAELSGRDEHIAAIEKVLLDKEEVRILEDELMTIYDGQDRGLVAQEGAFTAGDRGVSLRALIQGTDVSSFEIVKLSSNASFGVDYSGILMLKNKVTGEVRMAVINPEDSDELIPFGVDPSRNNIFGKYLTNNAARIALPTIEWKNTVHNMRLIKAGLVMIQQKQLDKDFSISVVVSNPGLNKNSGVPNIHDVATILEVTKTMLKVMKDAGEVLPESLLKALQTPEVFDPSSYIKNPVNMLSEYLSMTAGEYVRIDDFFKKGSSGESNKKKLKLILDTYDPKQDNHKLIDALHDFRHSISQRLRDPQAMINNDLFRLTDNVILFLKGFNYDMNPKNTTFVDNLLYTPSKMSNKYGAAFNRKTQESAADIRAAFMVYKNKHNKLLEALAKANNVNLSWAGPAIYKASMKEEMFKNLYTTDNTDGATAFILKDPSQVTKQAEKDYIIYLRDTFEEFASLASHKEKVDIPYGWMPLVNKTSNSARNDMSVEDRARASLSVFNFNSSMRDAEGRRTINNEFSVDSKFSDQLPGKDSSKFDQFSYGRRKRLSLDSTMATTANAVNSPISRLEDNLENVLDSFVIDALDTYHYKDVSEYGRALFFTVSRFEALSKVNYSPIIDTIVMMQRRVVSHHDGDKGNKIIRNINAFATNAAIAGTVSQALLETFTNPFVTSANYIGDKLYGALFSGSREFSLKSYSEAFRLVALTSGKTTDTIEAICNTYGITSSDTAAIRSMMNKLESQSLFKSDNLMYVNKLMMESWQKITTVAYMLEQGSFYAHSINDEGNLVYDEKKDKRFHFSESKSSDKYEYKKKFYEATKLEMAKQRNGLNQDGATYEEKSLKKAWTTFDANHVKEMVVELYSSLDDTSKSLATSYTYLSFVIKMRTWLFSKVSRYFQSPMTAEENASASRLVKVYDDKGDYKLEWKGSDTEGILWTLWSILQQCYEYKTDIAKKGSLTEKQKKNLSLLTGDLLVWGTLGAAGAGLFKYALDDETRKDETVKLLYQRWMMATGDVFVLKSITDMVTGTGSMMIGVSVLKKFAVSVADVAYIAPQVLTNPDVTAADLVSASKTMVKNAYGPAKSVEIIGNIISPPNIE